MRAHCVHYMGYVAFICVIVTASRLTGAEIDGHEVLEQLRSFDKAFLQLATINLDSNCHSNWPEPNQATFVQTTLTTDGSSIGWTREIFYISPPAYVKEDPSSAATIAAAYDENRNYSIWRPTRSSALIENDFQAYHKERILLSVSPEGTVTEREGAPTVEVRRADDSEKFLDFKRVLWSSGRGFADHLDKIVEAEQDQDGFINIEAHGSFADGIEGVWKLKLDPDAQYLVRSASFTQTGLLRPTYLFTSTGTKSTAGVPVAEEAVYSMGGNIKTVKARTSQFQPKVQEELLDKLRNKLRGQLPKNTSVREFRNNPREPSSYIVGRGPMSDKQLLDILVNPLRLDSTVQDTKENALGELDAPATHDGNEVSVKGVNQSQDETLNKEIPSGGKSIFRTITIGALSLILCACIITTLSRKK